MLLTTGVIYVLNPVIVMNEFLLNIVVDITPVYNLRCFITPVYSLDLIIKSLLRTNCCLQ